MCGLLEGDAPPDGGTNEGSNKPDDPWGNGGKLGGGGGGIVNGNGGGGYEGIPVITRGSLPWS